MVISDTEICLAVMSDHSRAGKVVSMMRVLESTIDVFKVEAHCSCLGYGAKSMSLRTREWYANRRGRGNCLSLDFSFELLNLGFLEI
jgi:hypothetical protein